MGSTWIYVWNLHRRWSLMCRSRDRAPFGISITYVDAKYGYAKGIWYNRSFCLNAGTTIERTTWGIHIVIDDIIRRSERHRKSQFWISNSERSKARRHTQRNPLQLHLGYGLWSVTGISHPRRHIYCSWTFPTYEHTICRRYIIIC